MSDAESTFRDDRVFRLINGIHHSLADRSTWTQRGLNYYAARRLIARSFEFHTLGLTRFIGQRERFATLAREIDENEQETEIHVAHSYGTTVDLEAIKLCKWKIDNVWLVQGACQSDFEKNGLNRMIFDEKIGEVHVLWSRDDSALRWARFTTGLLKFGWLGLEGPQNVDPVIEHRVHSHLMKGYGHNAILDIVNLTGFLDQVVKESEREPVITNPAKDEEGKK